MIQITRLQLERELDLGTYLYYCRNEYWGDLRYNPIKGQPRQATRMMAYHEEGYRYRPLTDERWTITSTCVPIEIDGKVYSAIVGGEEHSIVVDLKANEEYIVCPRMTTAVHITFPNGDRPSDK